MKSLCANRSACALNKCLQYVSKIMRSVYLPDCVSIFSQLVLLLLREAGRWCAAHVESARQTHEPGHTFVLLGVHQARCDSSSISRHDGGCAMGYDAHTKSTLTVADNCYDIIGLLLQKFHGRQHIFCLLLRGKPHRSVKSYSGAFRRSVRGMRTYPIV